MVTNEVYVSSCRLRRVLIFSYHYKNDTELQSVQMVRIVSPVKEIKRGAKTSRRSIFNRNFGKSQQEDVFEGEEEDNKPYYFIFIHSI